MSNDDEANKVLNEGKDIPKEITLEQEFKSTLNDKEKLFLCEQFKDSNCDNNLVFRECTCGNIICDACKNLCHRRCSDFNQPSNNSNILNEGKKNDNHLFMVSEYFSSCECVHPEQGKENSVIRGEFSEVKKSIPCFFSHFLTYYFDIQEKYYSQNKKNIVCKFCYLKCLENNRSYSYHEINTENSNQNTSEKFLITMCECKKKECKSHRFDEVLEFVRLVFNEQYQKIVDFEEINIKFKMEFNSVFYQHQEFNQSIHNKFAMYTIMFKENIILNKMYEKSLLEFAFLKIEEKDKLYFFQEKKNIILTYIFYYYKKYYFDNLKLMSGKMINMLSFKQRIELSEHNSNVKLSEDITDFINLNFIKKLFVILKDLRFYAIKASDEEPNTPFIVYFLKLFFQIYSYELRYVSELFKIINEIRYKYDEHQYNSLIKKNIDEIFYIFKMHAIDEFLKNQKDGTIIDKNFLKDNKSYLSKILNFEISEGDKFRFYTKMIFQSDSNPDFKNMKKRDIIYKIQNDDLIYMDCFHKRFISKIYKFISPDDRLPILEKKIETEKKISNKKKLKNLLSNEQKEEENLGSLYDLIGKKIKLILKQFGLLGLTRIKCNIIRGKLLGYIFFKLKQFYYEKKKIDLIKINLNQEEKKKLDNLYKFNLDFSEFWKMHEERKNIIDNDDYNDINDDYDLTEENAPQVNCINFQKIKLDETSKRDLEFIFKLIFLQESYKNNLFIKCQFEFNLLLFILVSNSQNMIFFIKEIKFFDYLFLIKRTNDGKSIKKSFLIRSLFNTKESLKNFDFIWRIFYLIYRYLIDNEDEFNYLKNDILKIFINEIVEFYIIQQNKLNSGTNEERKNNEDLKKKLINDMNFSLIFFFLKIFKKMFIKSNLKSIRALDFNLNKYSSIENLNHLIDIVFSENLEVDEYFDSFFLVSDNHDSKKKIQDLVDQMKIKVENEDPKNEKEEKSALLEQNIELTDIKINSKNIDLKPNLISDKLIPVSCMLKITKQHILILVLDIWGYIPLKSDYNIDLKFLNNLNKNYTTMKNFLLVKKEKNEPHKYFVFKFEKIIIKYLSSLLKSNLCDFSKINYIINTDLTDQDLTDLGLYENFEILKAEIDMEKNPLISKFILNKIRIKIMDIFIVYLNKESDNYDLINNNFNVNNFILINFSILLKDYMLKKKEGQKLNLYYEGKFEKMFEIFLLFLKKNYKLDNYEDNAEGNFLNIHLTNNKNFSSQTKSDLYDKIYKYIYRLFTSEKFKIKKYHKFYGTEDSVFSFYKKFILYDSRNKNMNVKIVEKLYCDRNIYDKQIETKRKFFQTLSNIYWMNIVEEFINKKDEVKVMVIEKLIENLVYNLKLINHLDIQQYKLNFDCIFSENFLKTLNMINHLLYYQSTLIQDSLKEKIKPIGMSSLLKNIIKLNNFIIVKSSWEINNNYFSICKVYYLLMDFIILLGEGIDSGDFTSEMFKSFENFEKKNETKENLIEIEDFLNNSTVFDDKIEELNNQLFKLSANETYKKVPSIIYQYKDEFFNMTYKFSENLQDLQEEIEKMKYPIKAFQYLLRELNFYYAQFLTIQEFNETNNEKDDKFIELDDNSAWMCHLIFTNLEKKYITIKERIEKEKMYPENSQEIETDEKNEFLDTFHLLNNYIKYAKKVYEQIISFKSDKDMNSKYTQSDFNKYIYKNNKAFMEIHHYTQLQISDLIDIIYLRILDYIIKEKKIAEQEQSNNNARSNKRIIKENPTQFDINEKESENTQSEILDGLFNSENSDTNNFFFYNFQQLGKIINYINISSFSNYCCSSDKLIIQFLYISRFLKENTEISNTNNNSSYKIIIHKCFNKIFDFEWILMKDCKNENLSFVIRISILKLLLTYMEESSKETDDKCKELHKNFKKKLEQDIKLYEILDAIIDCFEKHIPKDTLTFSDLINLYIKDEDSLYTKKWIELAELYYKFLKTSDLFLDVLDVFRDDLASGPDKEYFKYFIHKSSNSIVEKNDSNETNYDNKFLNEKDKPVYKKYNKEKYSLFVKFLLVIGKQIEVNFYDDDYDDDNYVTSSKISIYFFKSPKCFWMNNMIKEYLLENAPRNSIGAKLDFFNKTFDKFLLNINISYKERTAKSDSDLRSKLFKYFNIKYMNGINFIFAFATNLMLLYYFCVDFKNMKEGDLNTQMITYSKYTNTDLNDLIKERYNILFFQTIFFSLVQIILFFFWYIYRFIGFYWIYYYDDNENNYYLIKKNQDYNNFANHKLENYLEIQDGFKNEKSLDISKHDLSTKIRIGSRALLFNSQMISITLCFLLNILYLITNYKLLLVLQILAVINMYSLFEYFLQAIYNKYKEFVSLLIFIYCVEYIFSWVTFLHFQEFMITDYTKRNGDLNQESGNELLCSTAIECFLNYVDLGLRLGGGMGDSAPRISFKFDTAKNYYSKILFDVIFHIVINLILANIFFGVIVDAFNEMRDEKDKKESDQNDKCYMCNRDRYDSSKEGDFEYHRNIEHNIFNYIYFIPYLLKKNPQEYSRAENYVWEKINLHNLRWLPTDSDDLEYND